MTTMTTLDDVRTNLVARGYPADQVDEMINLAGRMILEGSLASKEDVTQLRDEFTLFKIDVAERFAELRAEMDARFAELRAEMDTKFAELRAEINVRFAEQNAVMTAKFAEQDAKNAEREGRILRWVFGGILAGMAINAAIVSIGVAVIAQMV